MLFDATVLEMPVWEDNWFCCGSFAVTARSRIELERLFSFSCYYYLKTALLSVIMQLMRPGF